MPAPRASAASPAIRATRASCGRSRRHDFGSFHADRAAFPFEPRYRLTCSRASPYCRAFREVPVITSRQTVRSCALLLLLLPFASGADAATLGRGLAQLVSFFETQNPNLSTALRIHVTAPDGEVLVHVRLADKADKAATLKRLAEAGFRLTATSELE